MLIQNMRESLGNKVCAKLCVIVMFDIIDVYRNKEWIIKIIVQQFIDLEKY